MTTLINRASTAARNDWIAKMGRNQDAETIQVYQMIAVFDPRQKDAFTFTSDEILRYLRPIHDSIYGPTEAGLDPLKVSFSLNISICIYFNSFLLDRSRELPLHPLWSYQHDGLGILGRPEELQAQARLARPRTSFNPQGVFRC
jgi:hypothetical protein